MHTCGFIPQAHSSKTIVLGERQLTSACFKMKLHFSWLSKKKKGTNDCKIACLLSVGFYLDT